MKRVAVILHTFLRDELLFKCIDSILEFVPDVRLYLADGGLTTSEKEKRYKELKEQGHVIRHYPFDMPFTITRNELLKDVKEPYVIKCDDDFQFTKNSRIEGLIDVLEHEPELGLISSEVEFPHKECIYYFNARKEGRFIILRKEDWKLRTCGGVSYFFCDVTPDYFVAKREMFDDVNWDEDLHVGEDEHDNFFFRVKWDTKWKVAYSPNCSIYHMRETNDQLDPYYRFMRYRFGTTKKVCKKWQIDRIIRE